MALSSNNFLSIRQHIRIVILSGFSIAFLFSGMCNLNAQEKTGLCIIDNIKDLESQRDPKCHATASRLEDFMYGTPLNDEAREKKIELQKKLILYIWNKSSEIAKNLDRDSIEIDVLEAVINSISRFGKLKTGEWFVESRDSVLLIDPTDLRQYASVAYALRAMLSVEQDFLFNPQWELMPFNDASVNGLKVYIDLLTLGSLQLADSASRKNNSAFLGPKDFETAWITLLGGGTETIFLTANYPSTLNFKADSMSYITIRSIIDQKIESYKAYNDISLPILLRNIQVYFARHKWPSDTETSDILKNYFVESLVLFCQDLLLNANGLVNSEHESFIRSRHVNSIIPLYLPFEINSFEDVIYFPRLDESIMIESYDLDAFRDSGLHWLIMEYALDDLEQMKIYEPDPFAAELVVETVAQMALLVLRITGDISISEGNPHIMLSDMQSAFMVIQELIKKNAKLPPASFEDVKPQIKTSMARSGVDKKLFYDVTQSRGIDFMHKSSDWLSRQIRSYVVLEEDQLIRMAIPPAFGGAGVASEDINNDNWPDIILLGGMGVKLYLNNGNGQFEDITLASGIDTWNESKNSFAEPRQIIVADFDNDGWQDIFISLVDEQHKMYRNINGLRFEDLSDISRLGGENAVAGPATAFDYDNDGLLDIYIGYFGNYLNGELPTLSRTNQNGDPNKLFKNTGGFNFEEQEHLHPDDIDTGWTQAMGHTDINQDGWQDVIIGNDFGVNAYYINQGNGYFKNMARDLGTDKPSYTMNVGSTDLNGDHFPDLYISNIVVMEKDEKYVNPSGNTKMNFELEKMETIRTVEANDLFISRSSNDKLDSYIRSDKIGRGYSSTGWSWDADFFDFDNDGDEDLYCLNGMNDFRVYGSENPYYSSPDGEKTDVLFAQSNREKNNFFVNENGMLIDKAHLIGGDLLSNSRSAAYLDFDRDGDLDIVINNYHDKAVLLENTLDNTNNWIAVQLVADSESMNRDAIGSNVIIKYGKDANTQWKELKSTTGYLSVHPKVMFFGLGDNNKTDIEVRWPNGETQTFDGVEANSYYRISYTQGVQRIP